MSGGEGVHMEGGLGLNQFYLREISSNSDLAPNYKLIFGLHAGPLLHHLNIAVKTAFKVICMYASFSEIFLSDSLQNY